MAWVRIYSWADDPEWSLLHWGDYPIRPDEVVYQNTETGAAVFVRPGETLAQAVARREEQIRSMKADYPPTTPPAYVPPPYVAPPPAYVPLVPPTYQVVAQGDFDTFAKAIPAVSDLPAGTPVLLRVDLQPWAPVGKLADLAGTELWAQKLVPAHIAVDDVYGSWGWVEVRGHVSGSYVPLIIAGIVAALVALGYAAWVVKDIVLSADIKTREQKTDDLLRDLMDKGLTPQQAVDVIAGTRPAPPGVTLPDWVKPAAQGIGAGIVVLAGLIALVALRK